MPGGAHGLAVQNGLLGPTGLARSLTHQCPQTVVESGQHDVPAQSAKDVIDRLSRRKGLGQQRFEQLPLRLGQVGVVLGFLHRPTAMPRRFGRLPHS